MSTRPVATKSANKRMASPAAPKTTAAPAAKRKTPQLKVFKATRKSSAGPFIAWYKMDFNDKILAIRSGVPAQRVGELSAVMDIPKEALMDSLGLSRATINRKVQLEQALSPGESERVMGMQSLIGQVQAMIDAESAPHFDAAKWLAQWLAAPLPALGGNTPGSYMDTVEGQKYVSTLLEMAQSGAYA